MPSKSLSTWSLVLSLCSSSVLVSQAQARGPRLAHLSQDAAASHSLSPVWGLSAAQAGLASPWAKGVARLEQTRPVTLAEHVSALVNLPAPVWQGLNPSLLDTVPFAIGSTQSLTIYGHDAALLWSIPPSRCKGVRT